MHDDRDDVAFAAKPLLDINAVVDAYCEADAVRQVAERTRMRGPQPRFHHAADLLNQWADAREASVAAMLEG